MIPMDIPLAEVVIAGLGVLLAWLVAAQTVRVAAAQNHLSASSVAADWIRDLREWAAEAIDVLAEASYMCRRGDPEPTAEDQQVLLQCRHRLSALIDRGRLYLPNERETEIGASNPRAYRGLRHPALDALVAAECVLAGSIALGAFPDRKSAMIGMRREFVSAIQAILDPHTFNREVARLLRLANAERVADPTLGGLLPDATRAPQGAEALMQAAGARHAYSARQ
jgi:hypothetical protein